MKPAYLIFAMILVLILAACSSIQSTPTAQPTAPPAAISPTQPSGAADLQLSEKTDQQGAVTVTVKPQPWISGSETLDFEVALNTHSIDLSYDLAALSTLATDTGLTVQATSWVAPGGGHHVSGRLSFPANVSGKPVLDEARKLTLTIQNLDSPERTFTWDISS